MRLCVTPTSKQSLPALWRPLSAATFSSTFEPPKTGPAFGWLLPLELNISTFRNWLFLNFQLLHQKVRRCTKRQNSFSDRRTQTHICTQHENFETELCKHLAASGHCCNSHITLGHSEGQLREFLSTLQVKPLSGPGNSWPRTSLMSILSLAPPPSHIKVALASTHTEKGSLCPHIKNRAKKRSTSLQNDLFFEHHKSTSVSRRQKKRSTSLQNSLFEHLCFCGHYAVTTSLSRSLCSHFAVTTQSLRGHK